MIFKNVFDLVYELWPVTKKWIVFSYVVNAAVAICDS